MHVAYLSSVACVTDTQKSLMMVALCLYMDVLPQAVCSKISKYVYGNKTILG